jgi:hypothetical protein
MLFPVIARFAEEQGYELVLSEHQNHYPDISLILPDESKIAVDFKSTYRTNESEVNGFTLGAFTGYFRQRKSTKNITLPYGEYTAHFVLGTLYSRNDAAIHEQRIYSVDDLHQIAAVAKDFAFILQEKWRIASDRPGSGNTKNIGSVREIEAFIHGGGPFGPYGLKVFDDYWMNYLTLDMAKAIDSEIPYHNLEDYWQWRNR